MGMRQYSSGEPRYAGMVRELERGPWPMRDMGLAAFVRDWFRDREQVERDVAIAEQLRAGTTGPGRRGRPDWRRTGLHVALVALLAVAVIAVGLPVWMAVWLVVGYGVFQLMR